MKDGVTEDFESDQGISGCDGPGYPGALELDVEKYRPYVDGFDLSEERKVELLQTLWSIMRSFVERGWGVDSVQNFIPALRDFSAQSREDELEHTENKQTFNAAATDGTAKTKEKEA